MRLIPWLAVVVANVALVARADRAPDGFGFEVVDAKDAPVSYDRVVVLRDGRPVDEIRCRRCTGGWVPVDREGAWALEVHLSDGRSLTRHFGPRPTGTARIVVERRRSGGSPARGAQAVG